jgi:peptidyl-prolyl cis-trans isomerase C
MQGVRVVAMVAALSALAALSGRETGAAGAGPESTRRAQIAVRVGALAVSVGEVEDRIAALASFQRSTFGSTPAAAARGFVTEIVVPEALLLVRADATGVGLRPPAAYAVLRAQSNAVVRAVRARIDASVISNGDVHDYYEKNRDRFSAPAAFQIWRILCPTRQEAEAVLDACKADPTPLKFSALARDHSLDKGTYLRGGSLGFVSADGSTPEPGLRVDPAVVGAVAKVRDGDFVPTPVAEGPYYSVVWRRGTRPATLRSVTEAAPQIRDTLRKLAVKEETDKLVARLRAAHLRDLDEAPLEAADIPAPKP